MTWSEFQGLSEALGDDDEKQNRRFGRVMALLANIHKGKGQPSKDEEAFIPKRTKKDEGPKSKEELSQQISDVFSAFM